MAQAATIKVIGAVTAQPQTASIYSCTLQELLPLQSEAVYEASRGTVTSVASTDLAPFSVPFEGITKGRLFALRLLAGVTMKVKVTTALGVATFPVSDLFLLHVPNPGDEVTAIQLVGTGDVAYALAGDIL